MLGEPEAPGEAAGALERGNVLASAGDSAAALGAYRESERLAHAGGEPRIAILAAASAARAAVEADQLDGIEAELARIQQVVEALPDAGERARLLIHIGRTHARLAERRSGSLAALRRAAQAYTRAAEAASGPAHLRSRSYALGYLGEVYERRGRHAEALELSRRALFAAQAADAPGALFLWQWQMGRIHRATGASPQALTAYREAVGTLGAIREQTAFGFQDFDAAYRERIASIYIEFVELLLEREAVAADDAGRQVLLAEARNSLEDQKAAELRDYFSDPCLDALRKETPDEIPGTLVIYPIILPDRVEIILSIAGRLERYTSPVDRDTLVAEVRDFRHNLERRNTRQHRRQAQQLYEWLIRPIEPTLEAEPIETLVFVPGGPLRTIPFGALRDAESREYLIEKYPLAVVPSLTLTDPRPIDRGHVRLLAAGISDAVQGYPALVNVESEIDSVKDLFPGDQLLNDQFVIDRFEGKITGRPFGIVHIASHGEFSGDPEDSYLLAYDGKISMNQLSAMVATTQLRAEQPLELLTLSACETAAGNDRAALGLAGVALRSGARSALASLWSVNDEATAELVTEFYTQLGDAELSRAEALQRAQIKLLKTHHYRHPAFWSPFLLISSWL